MLRPQCMLFAPDGVLAPPRAPGELYGDVPAALAALRAAGVVTAALGNVGRLEASLDVAYPGRVDQGALSLALDTLGFDPERVLLVSASLQPDLMVAASLGLETALVSRAAANDTSFSDLRELLVELRIPPAGGDSA